VLFVPVDQALHPFPEAVESRSKGPVPVFVLLARNRDAAPVPPQVLPDFPAAIRFVSRHPPGATFGPPTAGPLDHTAGY
jgi:hypothetical protein